MRARVATVFGFALGILECAACTYDFTVGRKPASDAGTESDGAADLDGAVAGNDADLNAGDGGFAADAPFNCEGFAVGLAQLRQNAIACAESDPEACLTIVHDECGCSVGVGSNGAATLAYRQGLAMYADAGCTPTCNACPSTSPDFFCQHTGTAARCEPF